MSEITLTASDGTPLDGLLVYSDVEYSFRFEVGAPADLQMRLGTLGRTSLSVGTLQLEVDVATGAALFVWGLHPRVRWTDCPGKPERLVHGTVDVHAAPILEKGVTVALAEVGDWLTTYDRNAGWVRVTADSAADDDVQVLIASGTVLGIRNGLLNTLWLHPAFESPAPVDVS